MNFTKKQIAEMMERTAARAYQIWQIRLAARMNNTSSEHHPENIRRRMAKDRELLREALSV